MKMKEIGQRGDEESFPSAPLWISESNRCNNHVVRGLHYSITDITVN